MQKPMPDTDAAERTRRAEFVRETRAACQQRVSPEERTKKREEKADLWAAWFREKMDAGGCTDPVQLLPDALARLEQLSEDHAAAAIREIKALLQRALT
jgi:hypothetical protein